MKLAPTEEGIIACQESLSGLIPAENVVELINRIEKQARQIGTTLATVALRDVKMALVDRRIG